MERVDFILEGRECQLTIVRGTAAPAGHASEAPRPNGSAGHTGLTQPASSAGSDSLACPASSASSVGSACSVGHTGPTCPAWLVPDGPDVLLIEPIDRRDLDFLDREVDFLREHASCSFALATFIVEDWNSELSPWKANPVFGKEAFGDDAGKTLRFIEEALVPEVQLRLSGLPNQHDAGLCQAPQGDTGLNCQGQGRVPQGNTGLNCQSQGRVPQGNTGLNSQSPGDTAPAEVILGGYSLAALFALWAGYESTHFSGIAAASPSVWFPGWLDYVKVRKPLAKRIYLSLGDAEPKTRNRVMATVGNCIREMDALLAHHPHTLEWNPGNHFKDADLRTAKAFLWCLEQR